MGKLKKSIFLEVTHNATKMDAPKEIFKIQVKYKAFFTVNLGIWENIPATLEAMRKHTRFFTILMHLNLFILQEQS